MQKPLFNVFVALLLALTSMSLVADQYAVTLRDADLVAKPFRDADTIGSVFSDTRVIVLKRKGGWYKVRADDKTGWMRLTRLRLQRGGPDNNRPGKGKNKGRAKGKATAPGQQKKKVGSLDTLGEAISGGLFTTGRSTNVTSTTGIRGLDEEDIGNASPDPKALAQLDNYRVNKEQAQRFARKASLNRTKLDYLGDDKARQGGGGLLNLFGGDGDSSSQEDEEDSF